MGMLGNSNKRSRAIAGRDFYTTPVFLPIATYGYRLWYFKGARVKGLIKSMEQMQRRAALWITGAFRTSPGAGVGAHC